MQTVIYADILLAVNFSMDFLSLFITAKLTKRAVKPLRMSAAAMLGAMIALLSVIISAYIDLGAAELAVTALGAYLMVLCAFGGKMYGIIRLMTAYLAVNIGLGGLMTVLFSAAARVSHSLGIPSASSADSISPAAFIVAALISGAVSLAYGRLRERSVTRKKVSITVTAFGREHTASMMSDSGNLLLDPYTQKPVLIISASCASDWLPDTVMQAAYTRDISSIPAEAAGYRLRLIPVGSVTGSSLLLGFTPDRITADGTECDAVIAIDTTNSGYDGCGGIVPQSLLII